MSDDKRNVTDILNEWEKEATPRRESITPQEAVDMLNSLLKLDASAIPALTDHRVQCNEALAEHPTVQVGRATTWRKARPDLSLSEDAQHTVGLVGLLNGFFGMNEQGMGPIGALYQDVCDTCHEELNRPEDKGIKLGETCPRCNEGTVVIGPLVGFKNTWADQAG